MTQNYFVNVSNGLLDEEHQIKIAEGLWMYFWLLDKVTKIDDEGNGIVLGGKPIKLEEINIVAHLRTKRRAVHLLVKGGYVITKRTPYGQIFKVTKSKKLYGAKVGENKQRELPQIGRSEKERTTTNREVCKVERVDKNGRLDRTNMSTHPPRDRTNMSTVIKTIQYDNTIDIYKHYQEKINKGSKLLDKAKDKIKARLKVYSLEDLKKAMDNFSADGWWMKNNAHRGVAWFFHSDERIEQLMNMKPRAVINNNINQPEVAQDKYKNLNL